MPLSVEHTMRVLLRHGGRLVECAPEAIRYPKGEIEFTVHFFVEGDRAFNMFADSFGWALHEDAVMKLLCEGVLTSDLDIT
jgi:hypothetical protein